MFIDSITTRNFMGLKNVHVVTAGVKVNLFAGPNESRKSSLKDAIQVAFLGTSPRVAYKKDHTLLVSDGQRKGRITIKWRMEESAEPQEMYRNVDSEGAVSPKDFKFDDYSVACLKFALQIQSFADAKPEERKKLLTELLEIRMPKEEIVAKLKKEYEVDDARVQHISPFLRSGFEAAEKEAAARQGNARGAWEAATGEKWGDKKVLDWQPPEASGLQVVTKEQMDAANTGLAAIDNQIVNLVRQQAAAELNLKNREALSKERAEITELRAQYARLRSSRSGVNISVDDAKANIEAIRERLANIDMAKHVLDCPQCNAKLRLQGVELVPVNIDQVDIGAGDTSMETDIRHSLTKAEEELRAREKELQELDVKLARAKGGEARIAEIDAELEKLGTGSSEDLAASIQDTRTARQTRAEEVDKLRLAFSQAEGREKSIKIAKEAVTNYFAWKKVADAFNADGIPAQMLMEAIKPLNKRLEASAALAGWDRVQLNKNMELVRDTPTEPMRPYSLLSESAQWRASAIMADAISSMAGMKILILDRMDVLDLPGREQCMRWVSKLAEDEYHSIFLFATMKAKPTSEASFGARVHWMPDVVLNQSTGE